jgi:MFS family permease
MAKSIFKNIPKQVIILGLVSLFTDIASEMLYPVTPIFLTTVLGASMAFVGIIEGVAEFTAGLLKGYFGKISDKLGKRSIFVIIGYALSSIVKPLPGLIPLIPAVVFSRVADRVGKGIRTAPRDALLASYSDGNSGAIFGFHRGMDTLGAAIGPIFALLLLHFYPNKFTLIYLVAFIPSVIAIGFTLIVKDRAVIAKQKKQHYYSILWNNSSFQFKTLVVLVTIFSLVNSSDVFLILKTTSVLHSSTLAILGYILYNLVYAAASYPLGKLSDRFSKKSVFVLGLLIFSAVYFGFAVAQSIIFIIGLFLLYGIFAACTEGVAKAWVSDLIPDQNRGTAIGLMTMLSSFSTMLGSFLTGLLWDKFGSSLPFLISACISALIAFTFFFIKKE